jgi:hypothetical protein
VQALGKSRAGSLYDSSSGSEGHVAAAVGDQVPEGLELSWVPGSVDRALETVKMGRLR